MSDEKGMKVLKEKLLYSNAEMIQAVEHLRNAQKVHNEFYEITMEILNR